MVYLALRLSSVVEMFSSVGSELDSLLVISEMSEAPMIVSWEKNTMPIIRVIIAWKSKTIFAHLINLCVLQTI